ncbi:helix-turn-helix domain-containing protein [Paenibacillus larvae]|nr:helix-turn-helix domain-containing protein [Paenibacillus larvae]MDT2293682.1 helix-turn-helix domain-containing protein [Paenibacillus larvae]
MFQKEKSTYAPDQNPVRLTVEEQASLRALISKGQSSARAIRRAQILLVADENRPGGGSLKELEIAERMQVHVNTVYIVRKAYAQQGWEGAIGRKNELRRRFHQKSLVKSRQKSSHLVVAPLQVAGAAGHWNFWPIER